MARRVCQTVPGVGRCCQAAQAGQLNMPIAITTRTGGVRCGHCSVTRSQSKDPRKNGRPIFQFRFIPSSTPGCPQTAANCAAAAAGVTGTMTGPPVPMQPGLFGGTVGSGPGRFLGF